MQNAAHLASLGIQLGSVSFERQPIADHAKNLASTIKGNLQRSLESIGVDILKGAGKLTGEKFFSLSFLRHFRGLFSSSFSKLRKLTSFFLFSLYLSPQQPHHPIH
jgi:hypothetical protein